MNIWSSFRKKAQKNNKRQVCFFRQEYGYAMRLKYPNCTTNFVYVDFLFVPILNVYLSLVEYCLSTILQRVFLNYLGNAAFLGLDLIVNILMTSNTMNLSFCPYKFWYSAGNLVVPQGDFRVRWNLNITFFSFVALEVEGSL